MQSETAEYAVIFHTKRSLPMPEDYADMSKKMLELARAQEGFLRIESVADSEGKGVSVSYWDSLEAIKAWKENALHQEAQKLGQQKWYGDYQVEICKVLKSYGK